MPRMLGTRCFAEAVHPYGTTHVVFVSIMMLQVRAEMENMGTAAELDAAR